MKRKGVVAIAFIIGTIILIAVGMICFAQIKKYKVQENIDIGEKYLDELDYEKAIAAFNLALEIEPNNIDAYLGIIDAYVNLEDYEEALKYAKAGNELIADERILGRVEEIERKIFVRDTLLLAANYFEMKDFEKALEAYQEVLEVDADNLVAYKGIVDLCISTADFETALYYAEMGYEKTKDAYLRDVIEGIESGVLKCQVLGHNWLEANYQAPKKCTVCQKEEGTPLEPDFEKYGVTCDGEVDVVYPYATPYGMASVKFTDYSVFESAEGYEEKEGYTWRHVEVKYEYVLSELNIMSMWYMVPDLMSYYDWEFNYDDFEVIEGTDSYTRSVFAVDYYGETYSDCQFIERCEQSVDMEVGISAITFDLYVQMPQGYDGFVLGIYDNGEENVGEESTIVHEVIHFRMD